MRSLLFVACLAATLGAQVVEEAFARDPGPLDFIRGEGLEQAILQSLAGDSLVGLDPRGRVVSRLADRWEARRGSLRFHLRPGATFPDGSGVAAQDVLWTLREIQRLPQASPTKRAILEGVTCTGEGDRVELASSKPPGRLLMELARVPIAKAGHPELGSGPFLLARTGSEWRLSARPHFLGPKIPGLHFRLVGEEQAMLLNLRKGWLSLGVPPARPGLVPPPTHEELLQPLHAQLVVWGRMGSGALRALEGWRGEAFPPGFFGPKARASRGLWPETLGFPPLRILAREAPPRLPRWELLFPAGDELVQKALLALRSRAAQDGAELDLRPVESALLLDRVQKGDFELACLVVVFDPHPWSGLEYLEPQGPMNFTGWRHPDLPSLVGRLRDPQDGAWAELHRRWAEAPGALPLLDFTSVVWVHRRLQVEPSPLGLYLSTPGAAGWRWRP